jgi:hypothetical protein
MVVAALICRVANAVLVMMPCVIEVKSDPWFRQLVLTAHYMRIAETVRVVLPGISFVWAAVNR